MSEKSVEDYLKQLENESPKTAITSVHNDASSFAEIEQSDIDTQKLDTHTLVPMKFTTSKTNVINNFKIQREKGRRELEAAKIVFDTQLNKLEHRAEAAERESKAYWDAKSVEVAETIKNYVQSTIRVLENERLDSRNEAVIQAFEKTDKKLNQIVSSSMSETFKMKLIKEIKENLDTTVERIQNEAIAGKYDLD